MAEKKQNDSVKEITDKLEQGLKELFDSEKFKAYLDTMSKFHNYSFNNTLLIAMQKPDATLVAGYTTWKNQFGRQVNKGEKAIRILAPTPYKQKVEVDKTDPNTGEILALSEMPRYNLNEFNRNDKEVISTISRTSLISDIYEPGSTFKILTATANVEEYFNGNRNAFSLNHIFNSSRYRYIDGQKVKCWSDHKNGKHANLNLQGALNNSCNPIFVDIAMSLGKKTLYKYIEKLNYGSVTGIDISGESQGMILPLSSVKNVDLSRIAFGQSIAVTGLQLAMATSAIINGGNYYSPFFVKEIYDNNGIVAYKTEPKVKNKVVSEKTSSAMREMLESVVDRIKNLK